MKRVCNNHDYCRVDMPKEHEKIKYLPGEKSLKAPFIAYVDLECLLKKRNIVKIILKFFFFSYLGFLLRTFTNHRTAEEGGGHFFNSSLPVPLASQTLRY